MFCAQFCNISTLASIIEFIGALFVVIYLVMSLVHLIRTRSITTARLLVADGIIAGLNFKLAGTLLKTIELRAWQPIFMFVAIFVLRLMLKRLFIWERARLQRRQTAISST